MRVAIPFVGGTSQSRVPAANSQLTVNLYVEGMQSGARSQASLYSTPGLAYLFSSGTGQSCRSNGLYWKGNLYFVSGNSLVSINSDLVPTVVGTLGTSIGRVSMVGGFSYILLVDGTNGYTWNGTTFAQITDSNFPVAAYCFWQDGYFGVVQSGTANFFISSIDNPTNGNWNPLNYAVAEGVPQNCYRAESCAGLLTVLGEVASQVFYEAGNANFPFTPILPNGIIEWGMDAVDSLAKCDDTLIWLGKNARGDRAVIQLNGLAATPISTPDIAWQINQLSVTNDAIGSYYRQAGHSFYVLTFPTGGLTLVYDKTTNLWHNRQSYGLNRWRVQGIGFINGVFVAGDYASDFFYKMDLGVYTDNGQPIQRVRRGPIIAGHNQLMCFNRMELLMQAGQGLQSGQGSNPIARLRWSDDGGSTWSSFVDASMGAVGQYNWRCIWTQLGSSYGRIAEVSVSDPVNVAMLDFFADIEGGLPPIAQYSSRGNE